MKKILVIGILLIIKTQIYSQWVWQNPTPTGNNINDVKFISSNIGWFVGTNGTIFKTTNGGEKWFEQAYNTQNSFVAVYPITSENIYLISDTKILSSKNGGNTWMEILSNIELPDTLKYKFNDIYFSSDMIGWVIGKILKNSSGDLVGGLLLKTTDGGINWRLVQNQIDYSIESIQFLNDSIGYIAGGQYYSAICDYPPLCPSYSDGFIMKTTNGGISWQTVFSDTIMIWDIYLRSPSLGWATGSAAWDEYLTPFAADYIIKTTDGGVSWQIKKIELSIFHLKLQSIFFIDDYLGWAAGPPGVLKTTDGGENWTISYPLQREAHLERVFFINSNKGFLVGTQGVILQTIDGGENWVHLDKKFISGNMWDIFFINPDTGWFTQGEDFKLYKTIDRGKNWLYQNVNLIYAVDFPDSSNGWGVGYGGKIIHTEDGGNVWIEQNSSVNAFLKDVKFVNSKIGWAAGDGTILKTTDGGNKWSVQHETIASVSYQKLICQDSLRIYVLGYNGKVFTKNGGQTWENLNAVTPIFFLDPDTGWGRIKDSLYRTYNGGETWENLGQTSVSYYGTYFVDSQNGWTYNISNIYFSSDGGSSWRGDLGVDVGHIINSLYFIDDSHGWVAASGGFIIRYGYPEDITSIQDYEYQIEHREDILLQNYPNPFNNSTVISFALASESLVRIKIYNILGMEVRELTNEILMRGSYKKIWDGKNDKGEILTSGIYLCRLSLSPARDKKSSNQKAIKILLLK